MYKEKELEVDDGGEDVPEDVEVEKDKELELELDVAEGFSDEDDGGEEFEKEHFKKEEEIDKLDKKNASDDKALNIIDRKGIYLTGMRSTKWQMTSL